MKKQQFIVIVTLFFLSCNTNNSKKNSTQIEYGAPVPGHISKEEQTALHDTLTNYFDSTLLKRGFNGGILVAKKGNILYEKYAGKIDLRKTDIITDTTPFQLASTSKPFTSVAVLQLIQKKKLRLEDSLEKFFPGFPYKGITIKMLLNHHSGLPNYLYFITDSIWDKTKNVYNQDVLNLLFSKPPKADFPAGTRFSYSNTNFVILALLVEKIVGKSFPAYMKSQFFMPLKMKNTYVFTKADSASSIASFNYKNVLWQNDIFDMTYGDKNIYSTPKDLLKWDQALFANQLISKQLMDSAFAPSIIHINDSLSSKHNYGLGFRLMINQNLKKIVYHFGRWHGFNAAYSRLIDEEISIIILGNKFTRDIYNAAVNAYNIFGDYFPENNLNEEPDSVLSDKKVLGKKTKLKKIRSKPSISKK